MRLVKKSDFDEYIKNKIKKEDAGDIESSIPSVNPVSIEDVKITGTGIKGSSIIVDIKGTKYTGIVNENGEYSIQISKQQSGTKIKVVQKEEGKKESNEIIVEVGKTKLGKITINEVKNTDTRITGKAEKYADILLVIAGREFKGKANSNGDFNISVSGISDGDEIIGTQSMTDRVTSDETRIIVGVSKGNKPIINEVTSDSTEVTGKGVANSKVYVKILGKFEGYVDVNSNGDWEVNTGLLNGGQQIISYQELPRKINSAEVRKNVVQLPALRSSKNRSC